MTREQLHRSQMFGRVRDFGVAHKALFPEESPGGRLFAALAATVDAVDGHLAKRVVAMAEAQRVKPETRARVLAYLKTIASTARQLAVTEPGLNVFLLPRGRSGAAMVAAGQAFIEEAEKRQDEFVGQGLPANFISEFRALVEELEAAMRLQQNSHTTRSHARVGIKDGMAEAFRTVRALDVIVANTLRLDAVRLGAYRGARRIRGVSGAAAANTQQPIDVPSTVDTDDAASPASGTTTMAKAS